MSLGLAAWVKCSNLPVISHWFKAIGIVASRFFSILLCQKESSTLTSVKGTGVIGYPVSALADTKKRRKKKSDETFFICGEFGKFMAKIYKIKDVTILFFQKINRILSL